LKFFLISFVSKESLVFTQICALDVVQARLPKKESKEREREREKKEHAENKGNDPKKPALSLRIFIAG
jgi:hypothetical protein